MLKLILLPLDGSDFGEQAIPMALRIAERDHAELELVHVYEAVPPFEVQGAPPIDPTLDLDIQRDRASYLSAVAEWLRRSTSVSVRSTLLSGPIGETLADHVATRHADLIVMATHGRGGLSRLWLGSVASDLVRHSVAPVLLIRPTESGSRSTATRPFQHVLVPLDLSSLAEEAIEHAIEVAGDTAVEFVLLHVLVPLLYITEPAPVALPSELELRTAAESYLDVAAGKLRARGFTAAIRVKEDSSPARAILECAKEIGADLVAMETNGRSGLSRLMMGSVADKVVRSSNAPVLLHRPHVEARAEASGASGKRGERDSMH